MKITLAQVQALEPCYSLERLKKLFGDRTEASFEEVIFEQYPPFDKLWLCLQSDLLDGDEKERLRIAYNERLGINPIDYSPTAFDAFQRVVQLARKSNTVQSEIDWMVTLMIKTKNPE